MDIHIVQLDRKVRFRQLRLHHGFLSGNHLRLEPVDIYILQLDRDLLD